MTAMTLAATLVGLGFGLAVGLVLHYYVVYKPLMETYVKTVKLLAHMKRRGFVPQYDIEQPKEHDPSADVTEY